jgi:hypothetical protein
MIPNNPRQPYQLTIIATSYKLDVPLLQKLQPYIAWSMLEVRFAYTLYSTLMIFEIDIFILFLTLASITHFISYQNINNITI